MKAVFKVLEGPIEHDSIVIRDGEVLTIGRESQADVAVPGDTQMSSVHLRVESTGTECFVQDLRSTNGTFINEQQLTEKVVLANGDVLRCGMTKFQVELPESAGAPPAAAPAAATAAAPPAHDHDHDHDHGGGTAPPPPAAVESPTVVPSDGTTALDQVRGFSEDTAESIVRRFSLDDLPIQPQPGETPESFAGRLNQETGSWEEGLRFLAYALPKRPAVWWATRCVRAVAPEPTEKDAAVLAAAEEWVADPTDEKRRAAMDLAQAQECSTAACWAGVAAFWSHGSLGPPDVPPVPPKDEFTGKAVAGAIAIAAVVTEPEKAPEKRARFFEIAQAVAAGQDTWKE